MTTRDIYADDEVFAIRCDMLPASDLLAGFAKDPDCYRCDQTGLLSYRNKPVRRYQTDVRMMPSKKGLESDEVSILKGNNRLIIDGQLVTLNSVTQVHF